MKDPDNKSLKDKIRVLQIITRADWAGAQRVVYEISKYIKDNEASGIEMEVAVGDNGILAERLRSLGIIVHVLKFLRHNIDPVIDLRGYFEIKKLILRMNFDIVHCHSTKAGVLGRLAGYRLHRNRIIYTIHGFWPVFQYKGIKRKLALAVERFLKSITTDMVFVSKSDIKIAEDLGLSDNLRNRLIYNSVNIPKVGKRLLKRELNISEGTRIIGNVARVDEQKDPFRFVEVAKKYFDMYKDDLVKFVWVGDGRLLEDIKYLIKKYNLEEKVIFTGFRDRGEEYMADFDLLFMTSRWEGVPITILEACELKVPILSTDVGGVREIIGENNVFESGTPYDEIVRRIKFGCYGLVNRNYRYMAENYVLVYSTNVKVLSRGGILNYEF